MNPVFGTRRRAEEFNSLVESPSAGSDARYADFFEIVQQLRDLDVPAPRPEFVASLREELMSAADTLLVETPAARLVLPPRRTHRERRIAAAVGGVAIVGATTSMAMAAQSALPGDMLYPVKRAIENAHTGLSMGNESKGSTLLANAAGRLDEVSALSQDGGSDSAAISDTLNAFTDQASEASDLLLQDYERTGSESSITELRNFTSASMDRLAALEAHIPADARGAMIHAARVLTRIDEAARDACPRCGGLGIDRVPAGLVSAGDLSGAGQTVVVPAPIVRASRESGTSGDQQTSSSSTPSVPTVSQPGTSATSGGDGGTTSKTTDGSDPVTQLAEGLTGGGGDTSEPTSTPSLSGVPGVPGVDDVTSALTDPLKP